MVDIDTPITTAARRITRHLNASVPGFTSAFDGDGHHLETWQTGMWHADPADFPGQARAVLRSGSSSQRSAQDALDASAALPLPTTSSALSSAYHDHMEDLLVARELAAHRVEAAR